MSAVRWRGWLIAAAIFCLGVAVGGAGTVWWGARHLRRTFAASGETGFADRAAGRIGAELKRSLELSGDDATRVQAILDDTARSLKGVRVRAAIQAGAELRAAIRRIAATLPPEKRGEFYRIVAKRYERLGLAVPADDAPPAGEK